MMYELPVTIKAKEVVYAIRNRGDYRMVLDCFNALNDFELSKEERIVACLAIFLEDIKDISQVYELPDLDIICKEMMLFFNCGQEEHGKKQSFRLIDWEKDATLICSGINKVAGKEIRAEAYVHWWTFMGYYTAIGDSALSTVVSIRYKQSKNKKLEKHEREFVQDNPQYFNWDRRTVEQKEEDELIYSLWNKE